MFCNNCGFKLNQESIFCSKCGMKQIPENAPNIASNEQNYVQQNSFIDPNAQMTPDYYAQPANAHLYNSQPMNTKKASKSLLIKIIVASAIFVCVLAIVLISTLTNPVNRYKQAYRNKDSESMFYIYYEHIVDNESRYEKIQNYLEKEAHKTLDLFENEHITYEESRERLGIIGGTYIVSQDIINSIGGEIFRIEMERTN